MYDHLIRVTDELDNDRDLVAGTLDIYVSIVNNDLSRIMKRLTGVTVILAGIGAVAGIFGMSEAGNAFSGGEADRVLARDRVRRPRLGRRGVRPPPDRLDLSVPRSSGRAGALLACLALAAAGCDLSTALTAPTAPVNAKAIADGFVLETSLPKARWAAGEVIPVTTTFSGPAPTPRRRSGRLAAGR